MFSAGAQAFPTEEILRVLRPAGTAIFPDRTTTKSFPPGVDDWTHPYHGPDNNPQSKDRVAVAPYLTQFLAEPRYAPLPQVCVSSAGRMFKAFGHVAFKEREEAFLNKLVAFNGYNGSILWQRDLTEGVMIHRNTMIATPDKLYVGDDKSCKVIDTATGKLLDEIVPPASEAGGTFWKWMALENGVLYAMIGEQEQRDSTKRWKLDKHGWPWSPISEGWNGPENPWGYRPQYPGPRPRNQEGPLEPPRAGADGWPGHLHEGRTTVLLPVRRLSRLSRRQDRQGNLAQDHGERSGAVCVAGPIPESARLADELADHVLSQVQRQGPVLRRAAHRQAAGRLDRRMASILWENPYSNFQLVLRDDGLYGISGQIDKFPA